MHRRSGKRRIKERDNLNNMVLRDSGGQIGRDGEGKNGSQLLHAGNLEGCRGHCWQRALTLLHFCGSLRSVQVISAIRMEDSMQTEARGKLRLVFSP